MAGWLRKAESKVKAQHSWGWNFAEYGKNGFFDRVKKIFAKRLKSLKIPPAFKKFPRGQEFMKIRKYILLDNIYFLNCSLRLNNSQLVKKTVLDSQKDENHHCVRNFSKEALLTVC